MVTNINLKPTIPPLRKYHNKKEVDLRYMLVPPYASAHIHWDKKLGEIVYDLEEPILNQYEKDALKRIEDAMLELINVNVAVDKTLEATSQYIDKTARLLIDELNIDINETGYNKIFYYLFRDFIGLNEVDPMLRDYFIEDIECNGVDTPVFLVHRVYRNLRTNLVYKDIDKLASFIEKLAQRTGRYVSYAQPLLDGTLPDGSIDYNEPVIFKENGIVKVKRIGEVVDKYYNESNSDKEYNNPVEVNDIEVPAFDKDKYKISWKKVDYVYRHKQNEELYELKTEFGKKIKLTGCHSIFYLTDEGVKAERTDKLKVGDYVAIPLSLPENDIINEINLAEEFSKTAHAKKFVLEGVSEDLYYKEKKKIYDYFRCNYEKPNQAYYEHKKKRILPLELYKLIPNIKETRIKTTSGVKVIPILKINKDLMRFLGLYIAEGWFSHIGNHHKVSFCFHKDETYLIEDIRRTCKECFGVEAYVEPIKNNARKVTINSYALYIILKDILKIPHGAKNKCIPELIFNVNKELQQEFLKAWRDGDYGSTASERLMNDISYLSLFNGDSAPFYYRERISNIKGREIKSHEYYTNFFVRKIINPYPKMIPLEVFNPLKNTHMRLGNKRIGRKRLIEILDDVRYWRMQNLNLVDSDKFIKEWSKRGFIEDKNLTEKGDKTIRELGIVKNLAESDLGFAKILSIKRVKSSREHVYDFSVKDYENFIGGSGALCCHNSRINATYTKDVTSRGPTFTIRKFTKIPWTPTQLISMNTLSPEMLAYFWILLENKANILVSGSTASGKTTLLNALAFFIPPESRVVSLEDTREINLPRENWLPAVARTSIGVGKTGQIDLFEILKASFRQNPDYLIVGEVRGKEAFVLFQGMASGHSSLSTIHSDSVDTLIRRLETPPINLSPTLINSLDCVAIAIHAVVKGQETRKVREIVEIVNVDKDGTALVNTPFRWDPARDLFYFKRQSKALEKISSRTGIAIDKLQRDLITRARLLYELYRRKIFSFDEVGRIINDFYKNPAEILNKFNIEE